MILDQGQKMDFDDPCGGLLTQDVLNVWLYCMQGPGLCVTPLAAKEQSGFLLSFFHPEIAYLNGANIGSLAVFQFSLNCSHVTYVLGALILLKEANVSKSTCIPC